jgi:putative ubiquitin-RnfH superfamily antitoxin RatB of RatAB toxin-antitoxin module
MASADAAPFIRAPGHDAATIVVDVACSPAPREMLCATLSLPAGATVGDALQAADWPMLDAAREGDDAFAAAGLSAAVWGRARPLAHALRDGDRVEVLRALVVAPMDARRVRYRAAGGVRTLRERAAKSQKPGKG